MKFCRITDRTHLINDCQSVRKFTIICLLIFIFSAQINALDIVLSDNPDYFEIRAAEEAIALCGKVKSLRKIYIGQVAMQTGLIPNEIIRELKEDGFALTSDGTNVAVCSKPGPGVLYGVYALFRELGGDIFAHDCIRYPNVEALLKPFSLSQNPAFSMRRLDYSFYYWPKVMQNVNNTRLGFSPYFIDDRIVLTANTEWFDPESKSGSLHTQGALCPPRIYSEAHPEFFARDDKGNSLISEKTDPRKVHLCLSNSDVRQIAKERLLKWMESAPDSKYFQIGEGDDHNWCRCFKCRKLDPSDVRCFDVSYAGGRYPAHLTDRILNYANDLASVTAPKHPNKKLLVLAYHATAQIPLHEKLADNVLMLLCADPLAGNFCSGHAYCSKNSKYWKNYNAWKNTIGPKKMAIYEYIINYKNIYAPFFCLDSLVTRIKRYHKDGIDKIGFNGQPYLFTELYLYVFGKLLWQPDLDPLKLEKEFLEAYYGPASKHIYKVLALLRESLKNKKKGPHQFIFTTASPLINTKYCETAYAIFSEAEKTVDESPKILWRVRYAKLCAVLWGDLDQMESPNPMHKLSELAAICREAPDSKIVYRLTSNMGISFEKWSQKHFGFSLDEKTWLDDQRFK